MEVFSEEAIQGAIINAVEELGYSSLRLQQELAVKQFVAMMCLCVSPQHAVGSLYVTVYYHLSLIICLILLKLLHVNIP